MKFLIIGKNGQLGKEFARILSKNGSSFKGTGRQECDISDPAHVLELFENIKPDIVINCAAYNFVDNKAETDYPNAFKVNAIGAKNLAVACKKQNAFLVHFSTDYVFDGKKIGLYTEKDSTNPINEYARSKAAGEEFIEEYLSDYLIFRVSWLYGEGKNSFIYKLLKWAKTQEYLRIAYDEFSVPTSTRTVAEYTVSSLKKGLIGLFHLVNSGYASRLEWAKLLFKTAHINKFIYPVSCKQFNLPAERPGFSAMSNEKLKKELNREISYWDDELVAFCNNSDLI